MYRVQTDLSFTRRKRVNIVHDQSGSPVYVERSLARCFEYLMENDVPVFLLETENAAYTVTLSRVKD